MAYISTKPDKVTLKEKKGDTVRLNVTYGKKTEELVIAFPGVKAKNIEVSESSINVFNPYPFALEIKVLDWVSF